jgi:hypothetical protein
MNEYLKFLLDDYKVKSKHWIENYEKSKLLDPTSHEFRIISQVCNNINEMIIKYSSTIYSVILTFNLNPEIWPDCTKEDILQAQLVQDEVISTLKEHGMTFNFTRDEVFDMNSTHAN